MRFNVQRRKILISQSKFNSFTGKMCFIQIRSTQSNGHLERCNCFLRIIFFKTFFTLTILINSNECNRLRKSPILFYRSLCIMVFTEFDAQCTLQICRFIKTHLYTISCLHCTLNAFDTGFYPMNLVLSHNK